MKKYDITVGKLKDNIYNRDSKIFFLGIKRFQKTGKEEYLELSFNVFLRNFLIELQNENRYCNVLSFDFLKKALYSVLVKFIKFDDKLKKVSSLKNIVLTIYHKFEVEGVFSEGFPNDFKVFAFIEYLASRFVEEKRISKSFTDEVKLFFDIPIYQARYADILAVTRIRNTKYNEYKTMFGDIATEYINQIKIQNFDQSLIRVLEDMDFVFGKDVVGRFISLYHGTAINLPECNFLLKNDSIDKIITDGKGLKPGMKPGERGKRKITKADIDHIIELKLNGHDIKYICNETGIQKKRVLEILEIHQAEEITQTKINIKTKEEIDNMVNMYLNFGFGVDALSSYFKESESVVLRILTQMKIKNIRFKNKISKDGLIYLLSWLEKNEYNVKEMCSLFKVNKVKIKNAFTWILVYGELKDKYKDRGKKALVYFERKKYERQDGLRLFKDGEIFKD